MFLVEISDKNGPRLDTCMELVLMHGFDQVTIMASSKRDSEELLESCKGENSWWCNYNKNLIPGWVCFKCYCWWRNCPVSCCHD
jgi:hypothetical protein